MPPIPTAETPPDGLNAYWLGVWRHCLKVMKAQGSWAWELRPLLDEYVYALIRAEVARANDEELPWHRAAQRASALADQLVLTARARKALNIGDSSGDEGAGDPFSELDELAPRRHARSHGA